MNYRVIIAVLCLSMQLYAQQEKTIIEELKANLDPNQKTMFTKIGRPFVKLEKGESTLIAFSAHSNFLGNNVTFNKEFNHKALRLVCYFFIRNLSNKTIEQKNNIQALRDYIMLHGTKYVEESCDAEKPECTTKTEFVLKQNGCYCKVDGEEVYCSCEDIYSLYEEKKNKKKDVRAKCNQLIEIIYSQNALFE